jgi:heme a synthase
MDVVKQLPPEAEATRSGRPLASGLRIVRGPNALRAWAIVSLVMNIAIVVTGGLVRLTGSGLGCPAWPRCTEGSYVSHPELGIHGAIEFGNRLFTLVLIIAATLQGVIGGITVLTQLNPYVVGLHLLLSMVLISLAVWLVRKTWHLAAARVSGLSVAITRVTFVLMWLAIWLGTLVTGSGPHAGDENAPRNGLDAMLLTRLHTSVVYAAVAASVVCFWLLRSRAAVLLLLAEIVQAGIGIAQYQLGLPIWLVALHLLGASLAIATTTNLLLSVSRR